ncbi:Metallo-dependent phosphatase-like protein [Gloeopeniophorella convolvens]|nr:Metallo-dependent phosphatase-like protein [Gloeopeniophorella convolvens]
MSLALEYVSRCYASSARSHPEPSDLLSEISYNSSKDTLIHLGDITAKGTHAGSLSVLSFMSAHNVSGVRGNHDQKVIEWRAWMHWVEGAEAGAGSRWLSDLEEKWEAENSSGNLEDDEDTEEWVKKQKQRGTKNHKKWWSKIPKGWQLFSDHYRVARAMSKADYDYLVSLPLVVHLPSEHSFLAHAGLLPYDPTLSMTSKRQPLARLPRLLPSTRQHSVPVLRNAQELAILNDIKQNNDPWVVLNMRNLRKDNTVSRKTDKGKPWTDVWNGVISRCVGFDSATAQGKATTLPCHPSTVVYGHAASRGLDVNRWSIGLDTGCVYGRRLTALILETAHEHRRAIPPRIRVVRDDIDDDLNDDDDGDDAEPTPDSIPFGDNGHGRLTSVKCHKHREQKQHSAD